MGSGVVFSILFLSNESSFSLELLVVPSNSFKVKLNKQRSYPDDEARFDNMKADKHSPSLWETNQDVADKLLSSSMLNPT